MAFFSGQDTKTLQLEGNDTNCFLSLIVDTKGTYKAAVTRKVYSEKTVQTVVNKAAYEFFGEGKKQLGNKNKTNISLVDSTVIEYFMLDIQKETVSNPFDYLDVRFEEINKRKEEEERKMTESKRTAWNQSDIRNFNMPDDRFAYEPEDSFNSWLRNNEKKKDEEARQLSLFGEEEDMKRLEEELDWRPDPKRIHELVVKLITASLIISDKIDLKPWVKKHMERIYNNLFENLYDFQIWIESYVEFIISFYGDSRMPKTAFYNLDDAQVMIAGAMDEEISELPDNKYIQAIREQLQTYTELY